MRVCVCVCVSGLVHAPVRHTGPEIWGAAGRVQAERSGNGVEQTGGALSSPPPPPNRLPFDVPPD